MKLYKSETLNKLVYIVTNAFVIVLIASFFILPTNFFVNAQYLDSTSYQLENPVTIIEGGESSSTSFKYLSGSGQLDSGQSTSTNFESLAGTLYYTSASTPVLFATAGDRRVSLSWTVPITTYGNITSYSVGISTNPTGTYTYSTVGNITNTIRTGLINDTTYYFKIRTYVAGLVVSESIHVSATPQANGVPLFLNLNSSPNNANSINFSGFAYPQAKVFILKDGNVFSTTTADANAQFSLSLNNITGSGAYVFSIYAQDSQGRKSSAITLPIKLNSQSTTNVAGIFLSPTISVDKSIVKQGENLAIFGQSAPNSIVTFSINTPVEFFATTKANDLGIYKYNLNISKFSVRKYVVKSKSTLLNQSSPFGNTAVFSVGTETKKKELKECTSLHGDINCDDKINLVDFSVTAFWYKKPNPPKAVDLNGDGVVDLIDFSIIAFNWTG